ncbi:MAG TPA: VTT domain-containing protein [Acidimicrobiales bacterium]|nr:VTT domain-containing protein [Acidimicrobiales bacterium]
MATGLIATATTAGLGGSVALGLLVPMEAGIPIPPPADLVMFAVGERVAAGAFPLWLAVVGLEAVAVVGTAALFFASRGPGHALLERLGPKVGLTRDRLARVSGLVETHGRAALALGRGTPGLRTVTVVAAGASGIRPWQALPALALGSSVFLQLHLVLGLLLGPLAHRAFAHARGPALVGLLVLIAGAAVFWLARRGRRAGAQACAEAMCPACVALGALAERLPTLGALTGQADRLSERADVVSS